MRASDTAKCGWPWAKLVVPSSGSRYQTQRSAGAGADGRAAARLLADHQMVGERAAQALVDQRLHRPVGLGDEVDRALVLDLLRPPHRVAQIHGTRRHHLLGNGEVVIELGHGRSVADEG